MKTGAMKRIVAITVAMILIMAPLSTCLADSVVDSLVLSETLSESSIIEWILAAWRAWGFWNDVQEWEDEVEQYLLSELEEFLATLPSVSGLQEWIMDWEIGRDRYGIYVGNSNFLEDVKDFMDYLVVKYNLENKTVQYISENYSVNGITIYKYPFYVIHKTDGEWGVARITTQQNADYCYAVFVSNPDNYANHVTITNNRNGTTSFGETIYDSENVGANAVGVSWTQSIRVSNVNYNLSPWYAGYVRRDGGTTHVDSATYYLNDVYDTYTLDEIQSGLSNHSTINNNGVFMQVDLNLPGDDPSYTQGDGIKILLDADSDSGVQAIYLEVEFSGTVSVDNLPAIVSPSGAQDPGFSQVFLPIKAFVNTFGDSMTMIKDIAFRLPSQVWTIFYAILSITVIFGALHMFKEH